MGEANENNEVRVITEGGELVRFEALGDDSQAAWDLFSELVQCLKDGEIAQLIVDDLIAAEHNPEYDGPAAQDVTYYA